MRPGNETAAICGLFCGICPSYPNMCGGCLSTHVSPGCDTCGSGFRDCIHAHKVIRCHACIEFPCVRLRAFGKKHIENDICHHARVTDNLRHMGEIGVEAWVAEQVKEHTCPFCGKLIAWFNRTCPGCEG